MTSTPELDLRRKRAATNESVFRSVNDRIDELSTQFGETDEGAQHYVCECLDPACVERIAMPHDEYVRIRRDAATFLVAPGHEDLQVEQVVDKNVRWFVVRKLGVAAAVAEDLASAR